MLHSTRHHYDPVARLLGGAALCVSLLGLVFAMTGMGQAEQPAAPAAAAAHAAAKQKTTKKALPGASTTPKKYGLLRLNAQKRFPAAVIPTVAKAKTATTLGGAKRSGVPTLCSPHRMAHRSAGSGAGTAVEISSLPSAGASGMRMRASSTHSPATMREAA